MVSPKFQIAGREFAHAFLNSGIVGRIGERPPPIITITETMLYKEFLDRIGQPLDE
jgi:hypothetical protein